MTIGKTLEKYGVAPVIIDGRTFVPVRFVADELGRKRRLGRGNQNSDNQNRSIRQFGVHQKW